MPENPKIDPSPENQAENLTRLLRLKRYEQPPAEYFERFVREFQRRQRGEMLRQPLWRIMLDRTQTFFGEHSMGHLTHAVAMAVILLVGGLAALNITLPAGGGGGSAPIARIESPARTPLSDRSNMRLNTSVPAPNFQSAERFSSSDSQTLARPHYVMDARPVSYEPPFSF